jgi:GT2 family glycosyltransferase
VAFRRQVFDRLGRFDPRFLRAQDKDFGRRVASAGLKVVYRPTAVVLHRHKRTA